MLLSCAYWMVLQTCLLVYLKNSVHLILAKSQFHGTLWARAGLLECAPSWKSNPYFNKAYYSLNVSITIQIIGGVSSSSGRGEVEISSVLPAMSIALYHLCISTVGLWQSPSNISLLVVSNTLLYLYCELALGYNIHDVFSMSMVRPLSVPLGDRCCDYR